MSRETSSEIDASAAKWAAQLDAGSMRPSDHVALEDWLEGDSRRQGALWRARAVLALMVEPLETVVDRATARPDRRLLLGGLGLAAAVAVGVVLAPVMSGQRYRTLVGEIRRVPLADGSMAAINTDTTLDVRFQKTERAVKLDRGEAWFQVAKDRARPFVVAAGDIRVQAVGTAFSVRRKSAGAEVRVTEGVVEVWSDKGASRQRRRVVAGEQVFVSDAAGASSPVKRPLEMDRALSWREGQIVLDGDTIAAAAAEFNRYNTRKIVIVDPDLEGRTVVGWFRTNEPESFAEAVGVAHGAGVNVGADVIMLGGAR
ncbi:FecR family protein [Brevundimonas sp.]|jgi:transmembrane sensor|uniref:FecR family protein n=1 Tax=Brevundimonas sp. TaxID=1871086 RepID=UPI0028A8DE68|nr:FecR domain-containing protein [Brevundimonas sp.]